MNKLSSRLPSWTRRRWRRTTRRRRGACDTRRGSTGLYRGRRGTPSPSTAPPSCPPSAPPTPARPAHPPRSRGGGPDRDGPGWPGTVTVLDRAGSPEMSESCLKVMLARGEHRVRSGSAAARRASPNAPRLRTARSKVRRRRPWPARSPVSCRLAFKFALVATGL